MKSLILSVAIIATAITSFAQGYDTTKFDIMIFKGDTVFIRKPNEADKLREQGKLDQSRRVFEQLLKEDPTDSQNQYNYAAVLALMKRKDEAFSALTKALENDSTVYALNDADFYFLLDDSRWDSIVDQQVVKVQAIHGKYENLALAKELWRMKVKDQAFYYHEELVEKGLGRKSPVSSAVWELKHLLNKANQNRIEEIIDEHGWPTRKAVGGQASQTVFLIVQHGPIEIQKKYLPLMKAAADKGEAKWSSLALLIDRINLREGKQQIYGSQIYNNEKGEYYVKDLFEPEYVNQRREEVGLQPIEEYVKHWKIEWDVKQKKKN